MKKVLPFVAAIALPGAVSCNKGYTCDCTFDDGAGGSVTASSTITAKKKDAETWCDDAQAAGAVLWTGYSCTLNN